MCAPSGSFLKHCNSCKTNWQHAGKQVEAKPTQCRCLRLLQRISYHVNVHWPINEVKFFRRNAYLSCYWCRGFSKFMIVVERKVNWSTLDKYRRRIISSQRGFSKRTPLTSNLTQRGVSFRRPREDSKFYFDLQSWRGISVSIHEVTPAAFTAAITIRKR